MARNYFILPESSPFPASLIVKAMRRFHFFHKKNSFLLYLLIKYLEDNNTPTYDVVLINNIYQMLQIPTFI